MALVSLAPTSTKTKYVYAGDGDTAEAVLVASGTVVDRTLSLIGGVIQSARITGGVETKKWQYPNIHGDVISQADSLGNKVGDTFRYDPFGQPLDTSPNETPDNESGNFDYGWLGQHQRQTEHEGSLNVIEMGARQFLPGIGRFLQVDPVEGGSSNDYDYCDADPINCNDLDGQWPSLRKAMHKVASVASAVSIIPGPIGQAASAVAAVGYIASGDYKAAAAAAIGVVAFGGAAVATYRTVKKAKSIVNAASKAGRLDGGIRASRASTALAGRMWVGSGSRVIRDYKTGKVAGRISKDGTRVYRKRAYKNYKNFEPGYYANFERKRVSNYHVRVG